MVLFNGSAYSIRNVNIVQVFSEMDHFYCVDYHDRFGDLLPISPIPFMGNGGESE